MSSLKLKFQESLNSSWADEAHIGSLCNCANVLKLYDSMVRDKEIIALPDQVSHNLLCSKWLWIIVTFPAMIILQYYLSENFHFIMVV